MPEIIVRPAMPDDATTIAQIHVASWQRAFRGILPDAYLDSLSPGQRLPMWIRILSSDGTSMHVGVAEVSGQVAGFYSIGPSNEDDAAEVQMLYTIYLRPEVMRHGIGRSLLADAESRMRERGATAGVLRVLTANTDTRRFYERCGWAPEPESARTEDAWGQQVETMRYTRQLSTEALW